MTELKHHGVKGMHWGVHKEEDAGSSASGVNVEPGIHKDTRDAAVKVSGLVRDRYGYDVKNIKVLDKKHPLYDPQIAAFVEDTQNTGGRSEGTIFVNPRDSSKNFKRAEKYGWHAPGTANPTGLITHETSHSLFHSQQVITKTSSGEQKVTGGHIEARNKALEVAQRAAKRDGQTIWDTSGYARSAGDRGELEAELFSQYHWATNPAKFVREWGETLHKEMGVDPTPFREMR